MGLIPKDKRFFDDFEKGTQTLVDAAGLLVTLLRDYRDVPARVAVLKEKEHAVDDLVREVTSRLNRTFITPFDREDIHELMAKIDDVADFIEGSADRIMLYRVAAIRPEALALGELILQATTAVHEAVRRLRTTRDFEELFRRCGEVKGVEETGDRVHREAVAALFEKEKDPIELIKWKEILEILEDAIDRCEAMAEVVESIALKNA